MWLRPQTLGPDYTPWLRPQNPGAKQTPVWLRPQNPGAGQTPVWLRPQNPGAGLYTLVYVWLRPQNPHCTPLCAEDTFFSTCYLPACPSACLPAQVMGSSSSSSRASRGVGCDGWGLFSTEGVGRLPGRRRRSSSQGVGAGRMSVAGATTTGAGTRRVWSQVGGVWR